MLGFYTVLLYTDAICRVCHGEGREERTHLYHTNQPSYVFAKYKTAKYIGAMNGTKTFNGTLN